MSELTRTICEFICALSGIAYYSFAFREKMKSKKNNKLLLSIKEKEITKEKFIKACIRGGILAGIIGPTILLVSYSLQYSGWIGYGNIDAKHFSPIAIIAIFLFQILLGALLGFLCGKICWSPSELSYKQRNNILFKFFIFCVAFISIVIFRQLMTRDARVNINGYQRSDGTWAGGPLGEPDFETIATGLGGAIAFLILVYSLIKLFNRTTNAVRVIPSNKEFFQILIGSASTGFTAWLLVYIIYRSLISATLIKQSDVIYAPWIFKCEFPHPERYLLILVLCIFYIGSIMISINYHSNNKSNIIYTYKE